MLIVISLLKLVSIILTDWLKSKNMGQYAEIPEKKAIILESRLDIFAGR